MRASSLARRTFSPAGRASAFGLAVVGGLALVAGLAIVSADPSAAPRVWPPPDDATENQVVETLHREVRRLALKDPNPVRRAWAWRALQYLKDPGPPLMAADGLNDPSDAARSEAMLALSDHLGGDSLAARRARGAIARGLSDPSPRVRMAAASRVRNSGASARWTGLGIEVGLRDEIRSVRGDVTNGLQGDPSSRVDLVAGLVAAIQSPDANVQRFAWDRLEYLERVNRDSANGGLHARAALGPLIARGLASADPEIRADAILLDAPDPLLAARRALSDPDPRTRASVLTTALENPFGLDSPVAEELLTAALEDESVAVVEPAARIFTSGVAAPPIDRPRLLAWLASGDAAREALAFELWHKLDTVGRSSEAQLHRGFRLLEEFHAAAAGSDRRRLSVGLLAPLIRMSTWARINEPRRSPAHRAWELLNASIADAAAEALDDPHAAVRRAGARAIATFKTTEWAGIFLCNRPFAIDPESPRRESLRRARRKLLERVADPDVVVRREVARLIGHLEDFDRRDEAFDRAVDEAALALLRDPDVEASRGVWNHFHGRWRPEAIPTLLAAVHAPLPANDDPSELEAARGLRRQAMSVLVAHAPGVVPLDRLVEAACEDDSALQRLLDRDLLPALLARIDAAPAGEDELLANAFYSRTHATWDAADAEATLAFLERLEPSRVAVARHLAGAISTRDLAFSRDRARAWLRTAATRPELAYAAIDMDLARGSPELGDLIESDPIAAALMLPGLASPHRPPATEEGRAASPCLRALFAESRRRATPAAERGFLP